MQVLTGTQAKSFAHKEVPGGVVVVTTKPNQQEAAVRALNSQLNSTLTAAAKPTTVSALPPAALTYITRYYPGYRLVSVGTLAATEKQGMRYLTTIAVGRRPQYLLFDERGQSTL